MQQIGRVSRVQQIAAATIGNALEWYDFMIFGFLTAIMAKLFFPSGSIYCSLLASAATFGVGFLMRPIGGIVIGMYADSHGRKAAMQLIIALTTVAMAIMTFAPTYAAFGIGAPLLVLLARLIQGFATGGEMGPSTAFLVECATPGNKGLFGSMQSLGQLLSMVAGMAVGALITSRLPEQALHAWGWRIPFLIGMLICPVGLWMRKHLDEPDAYFAKQHKIQNPAPLKEVLLRHRKASLLAFALITSGTIATYIMNVYMPTYASQYLGLSLAQSFSAQLIYGLSIMPLIPLFGALSDRIGRRRILIASLSLYLLLLFPMFSWIIAHHNVVNLIVFLTVLGAVRAAYAGVISTTLCELFPTAVRSTGMSLAYNTAVMCFGGSAIFVTTWLIHTTGSLLAPAFYMMLATTVGLIASFFLPPRVDPDNTLPRDQTRRISVPTSV